jgi:nucleotide-binding universal stress UspA family protein
LAESELERRRELLRALAERNREFGCDIVEELFEGLPDEALIARATELGSTLIVIGPHGERHDSPWSLGSLAMRLIKGARVPVLVVRDERAIAAWMEGSRRLRVMVGLDRTPASRAALAAARELARIAPIDLVAGHVYSPGDVGRRYSLAQAIDSRHEVERIETAIAGEMRELVKSSAVPEARMKLLAGWGRVSYHLLDLTKAEHADLLAIGTHRRHGLERLWRGSVSLDLAAHAECNVLTVPTVEVETRPRVEAREIRRVLVPCDLSETSSRAVAWACSLLARGGTLHILHVAVPYVPLAPDFGGLVPLAPPAADDAARLTAEIEAKLRALAPPDATEREIETQGEVVTAFDAATAIVQAAERLDVDAICLTTHGRSGLSRALMGSVAEHVLRHAHVPLLVLTPRRDEAH